MKIGDLVTHVKTHDHAVVIDCAHANQVREGLVKVLPAPGSRMGWLPAYNYKVILYEDG